MFFSVILKWGIGWKWPSKEEEKNIIVAPPPLPHLNCYLCSFARLFFSWCFLGIFFFWGGGGCPNFLGPKIMILSFGGGGGGEYGPLNWLRRRRLMRLAPQKTLPLENGLWGRKKRDDAGDSDGGLVVKCHVFLKKIWCLIYCCICGLCGTIELLIDPAFRDWICSCFDATHKKKAQKNWSEDD